MGHSVGVIVTSGKVYPSQFCYEVWFAKKTKMLGHDSEKKFYVILMAVLVWTDKQTLRAIYCTRACITSCGENCISSSISQ